MPTAVTSSAPREVAGQGGLHRRGEHFVTQRRHHPVDGADAKFKAKSITVTATIDAQDPNRHGLIDVAGKLCLLVLAPNDYAEGLDSLQVERDQRDLPLHVSELTDSLFDGKATGPDEPDGQEHPLGTGRSWPSVSVVKSARHR